MLDHAMRDAERLCTTIRSYWGKHDYPGIKVQPETIVVPHNGNATTFVVIRSNIGPTGYPPR